MSNALFPVRLASVDMHLCLMTRNDVISINTIIMNMTFGHDNRLESDITTENVELYIRFLKIS